MEILKDTRKPPIKVEQYNKSPKYCSGSFQYLFNPISYQLKLSASDINKIKKKKKFNGKKIK